MSICKYCHIDTEGGGVYFSGGFTCTAEECWEQFRAESDAERQRLVDGLIADGLCPFERAWIGRCKKPGAPYCDEHAKLKCASCGASATHDCYETGQFVCGAPLCDECEHTTFPEGHNGGIGFNAQSVPEGMKRHCKKTEQKFLPWYAREPHADAGSGDASAAPESSLSSLT